MRENDENTLAFTDFLRKNCHGQMSKHCLGLCSLALVAQHSTRAKPKLESAARPMPLTGAECLPHGQGRGKRQHSIRVFSEGFFHGFLSPQTALFLRIRLSYDSRTRFVLPRLLPTFTAPQRRWEMPPVRKGVPSCSQISQECGTRGRLLPIRKPNPCASDDVQKRVSHGTEAAPRTRVNCSAVSTETACKTLLLAPRSYS